MYFALDKHPPVDPAGVTNVVSAHEANLPICAVRSPEFWSIPIYLKKHDFQKLPPAPTRFFYHSPYYACIYIINIYIIVMSKAFSPSKEKREMPPAPPSISILCVLHCAHYWKKKNCPTSTNHLNLPTVISILVTLFFVVFVCLQKKKQATCHAMVLLNRLYQTPPATKKNN